MMAPTPFPADPSAAGARMPQAADAPPDAVHVAAGPKPPAGATDQPEPAPPAEGACCGSGCDPCVWDLYFEERRRWLEARSRVDGPAGGVRP